MKISFLKEGDIITQNFVSFKTILYANLRYDNLECEQLLHSHFK